MAFPILIGAGVGLLIYSMSGESSEEKAKAKTSPRASENDVEMDFTASEALIIEGGISYFERTLADGTKVAVDDSGEIIMRDGEVIATGRVKPQSTTDCTPTPEGCAGPVTKRLVSQRVGDGIYAGLLPDVVI